MNTLDKWELQARSNLNKKKNCQPDSFFVTKAYPWEERFLTMLDIVRKKDDLIQKRMSVEINSAGKAHPYLIEALTLTENLGAWEMEKAR